MFPKLKTVAILTLVLATLSALLFLLAPTTNVEAASNKWNAKYWNNKNMSGDPILQRDENDINYDWGRNSPHSLVNVDNFSVRWKRTVNFAPGTYRFTATMDDGMRVYVDGNRIIDSWWDSQVHSMDADVYLNGGDHEIRVEYYEATSGAIAKVSWTQIGGSAQPNTFNNWRAEYFTNKNLSGAPAIVRDDLGISFNWGGNAPIPYSIPADNFSVRWTRNISTSAGRYQFRVTADDGVRVWVNNQLIVNRWQDQAAQLITAEIDLPTGTVPVVVEYYENGGGAQIQFDYSPVSAGNPQPSPAPSGSNSATVMSSRLNVRVGPGTQYGIITTISKGQTVNLAGFRSADSSWVMINWNGSNAWVSANPLYVQLGTAVSNLQVWQGTVPNTGGPIVNPTVPPTSGSTSQVDGVYYLNVRSGPGTQHNIVTVISNGTQVAMIGRNANSSWIKVSLTNGTIGWVNGSYLRSANGFASLPVAN